ncbi:NUDIX domain-containing protein [Acrocarpospora macrocephala]|uniref:Nudix hydrolase domain-containing protein n=1 Tax=Acrocarpospora macrocephala TaxID=150177 RepID=A0A5M3X5F5_9ACTN|nr:hypothetical protein Amac_105530 [Acrocarpospora macrocephala]
MIVNAHVFGMNAYGTPVYHLRRTGEGGLFDAYAQSFQAVWEQVPPSEDGVTRVARTEYYDDPEAPTPNALVVGVSTVITDEQGRILLQRRVDNGLWALPGGGMDLGESVPAAAVRRVGLRERARSGSVDQAAESPTGRRLRTEESEEGERLTCAESRRTGGRGSWRPCRCGDTGL